MAVTAAVAVSACATAPAFHPAPPSASIAIDFDRVWAAAVDVVAERNWSIASLDKASGLIITNWMTIAADYVDCGSAPLAVKSPPTIRFSLRIRTTGDGATQVALVPTVQQARSVGDVGGVVACASLGTFERGVYSTIASHARAACGGECPGAK